MPQHISHTREPASHTHTNRNANIRRRARTYEVKHLLTPCTCARLTRRMWRSGWKDCAPATRTRCRCGRRHGGAPASPTPCSACADGIGPAKRSKHGSSENPLLVGLSSFIKPTISLLPPQLPPHPHTFPPTLSRLPRYPSQQSPRLPFQLINGFVECVSSLGSALTSRDHLPPHLRSVCLVVAHR